MPSHRHPRAAAVSYFLLRRTGLQKFVILTEPVHKDRNEHVPRRTRLAVVHLQRNYPPRGQTVRRQNPPALTMHKMWPSRKTLAARATAHIQCMLAQILAGNGTHHCQLRVLQHTPPAHIWEIYLGRQKLRVLRQFAEKMLSRPVPTVAHPISCYFSWHATGSPRTCPRFRR